MLSYTQATLKAALTVWNKNSDPEFVTELSDIIQRGELALMRAIDFDPLVTESTAATAAASAVVTKPATLVNETELWVTVSGVKTPVVKRSRAWVASLSTTPGTPLYYSELSTTQWSIGPPALGIYTVTVVGQYELPSITTGSSSTTTYFSTKMPDLLYIACAIEACEFLKFWTHKAALIEEFTAKVSIFRGIVPNQELTQAGDRTADRQQLNPAKPPGA